MSLGKRVWDACVESGSVSGRHERRSFHCSMSWRWRWLRSSSFVGEEDSWCLEDVRWAFGMDVRRGHDDGAAGKGSGSDEEKGSIEEVAEKRSEGASADGSDGIAKACEASPLKVLPARSSRSTSVRPQPCPRVSRRLARGPGGRTRRESEDTTP